MNAVNQAAAPTAEREIAQTRIFRAPRELVFEMWTNPEHIVNWYGPKGFTDTVIEMDVRPGGVWRHVMHGPDGVDYQNDCRYLEIVRPERLVYEHLSPPEFVATVTFEEFGEETRMTMQMVFESVELLNDTVTKYGAVDGLTQTLGRLEELLAKHYPSAIR
jgi:uncharacterized protein YndB with AHSA1/START domain